VHRVYSRPLRHTTVWTATDDLRVVAFYAIAPTQFVRIELPSRRGVPTSPFGVNGDKH